MRSRAEQHQHKQQQQLQEVSTPRYSDISSCYLRAAKANHNNINNEQQAWLNVMSSIKKHNNNSNNHDDDDRQLGQIEVYDKQITQYFYEQDDSLISLNTILPQQQFKHIANKQLHLQPKQTQSIAYKFYHHNNRKAQPQSPSLQLQSEQYNKYYLQYLQWKQQQQPQHQTTNSNINNSKPTLTNNVNINTASAIDRNIQLLRYKQKQVQCNREQAQKQVREKLQKLSEEYHSKLHQVINNNNNNNDKLEAIRKQTRVQKSRNLGFAQVQYPTLHAVNSQKQQQQLMFKRRNQQKLKQMNQKSFIDLIKNPPKIVTTQSQMKHHSSNNNQYHNSKYSVYQQQQQIQIPIQQPIQIYNPSSTKPKPKQPSWQLDVPQLLKIPPHKFILFFTQNQHKITALATPDQLKQINQYRRQCIEKQEALGKLREKIAQYGPEVLEKLPGKQKDRLFELLYQDEVDRQKLRYS